MDEKTVYDKINEMLGDTQYPLEIRDISDLEEFLNDESSMSMDVYDDISRMYEVLMGEPDEDE